MNYFPIKIMCSKMYPKDWKIETKNYNILKKYNIFITIPVKSLGGVFIDGLERIFVTEYKGDLKPGIFCRPCEFLVEYEGDTPPRDLIKIKLIN